MEPFNILRSLRSLETSKKTSGNLLKRLKIPWKTTEFIRGTLKCLSIFLILLLNYFEAPENNLKLQICILSRHSHEAPWYPLRLLESFLKTSETPEMPWHPLKTPRISQKPLETTMKSPAKSEIPWILLSSLGSPWATENHRKRLGYNSEPPKSPRNAALKIPWYFLKFF